MPRGFVRVASVSEVPPGAVACVHVGGQRIAVCNVGGRFYAVEDVCTHDGASFGQAELDDSEITCPRHGAAFDVTTGAVTRLPAAIPVRTFTVRTHGDDIEVEMDLEGS